MRRVGVSCKAETAPISVEGPTPHSVAIGDLLTGVRTYGNVKDRGRWKTDSSMARYGKPTRALQQLGQLPVNVARFGLEALRLLPEYFAGRPEQLAQCRRTMVTTGQQTRVAHLSEAEQLQLLRLRPG